jgi:hypothetical protein
VNWLRVLPRLGNRCLCAGVEGPGAQTPGPRFSIFGVGGLVEPLPGIVTSWLAVPGGPLARRTAGPEDRWPGGPLARPGDWWSLLRYTNVHQYQISGGSIAAD